MRAILATFADTLTLSLNLWLLAALCLLAVPPADATVNLPHTRQSCVTRAEYRAVHVGTPARRAVRVWDGYGREGDLGRVYPYCRGGYAIIAFSGAPSIVTLKYRLAPGSDPAG